MPWFLLYLSFIATFMTQLLCYKSQGPRCFNIRFPVSRNVSGIIIFLKITSFFLQKILYYMRRHDCAVVYTLDSPVKSSNVLPFMYEIVYIWKLFYKFGNGMSLLAWVSYCDVTVMGFYLKRKCVRYFNSVLLHDMLLQLHFRVEVLLPGPFVIQLIFCNILIQGCIKSFVSSLSIDRFQGLIRPVYLLTGVIKFSDCTLKLFLSMFNISISCSREEIFRVKICLRSTSFWVVK